MLTMNRTLSNCPYEERYVIYKGNSTSGQSVFKQPTESYPGNYTFTVCLEGGDYLLEMLDNEDGWSENSFLTLSLPDHVIGTYQLARNKREDYALFSIPDSTTQRPDYCNAYDSVEVFFNHLSGHSLCSVRVSNHLNITDGPLLFDKTYGSYILCLDAGYYLIGCNGPAIISVQYQTYNHTFDLSKYPHYIVMPFRNVLSDWTSIPESFPDKEFNHNKPLTGELAYPADYTNETDDFECSLDGYLAYLSKYPDNIKTTSRNVTTPEFLQRLESFIDNCEKIHEWNMSDNHFPMEFTYYADWSVDEFDEFASTTQRYSGIHTEIPYIEPIYNNSNYRYLMPSVDPCNDEIEGGNNTLRETISKPQSCSVSWAFAITNSIEYAIKKLYFEEYDQILHVALSAQELIDCIGKDHNINGCEGVPLVWGFDYVFDYGIALRQYYPQTNTQGKCKMIPEEHKYHIDGYEKPEVYNKYGLFELLQKGPTAVTLAIDLEYFQFYRSDRGKGPYFNKAFWRPSIYGVLVEYRQYITNGNEKNVQWPYFAIETRLRACDSFVFRLPILETTENANIAGIAGFAIRPIVSETLPTPHPPTIRPTPTPTPTPTILPTPTPGPTIPPPPSPVRSPCSFNETYIKVRKNCGYDADEESFEIWDDHQKLFQSPPFHDGQNYQPTICLPPTVNSQYVLKMLDSANDSWDGRSWIQIEGAYGNFVFKGFATENYVESIPISLYYGIVKNEQWEMASGTVPSSWHAYSFDDSLWDIVTGGNIETDKTGPFYFRKRFAGLFGMAAYELRIEYLHGVIAYVNGNEVLRDNMPDGEITSSTLATGSYSKLSYRSIIRPSSEVARSISYISIAIHFPTTVTETPFIFDAFLAIYASSAHHGEKNCYVYPYGANMKSLEGQSIIDIFDFSTGTQHCTQDIPSIVIMKTSRKHVYVNGLRIWPGTIPEKAPTSIILKGSNTESNWTDIFTTTHLSYRYKQFLTHISNHKTGIFYNYYLEVDSSIFNEVCGIEVQLVTCSSK